MNEGTFKTMDEDDQDQYLSDDEICINCEGELVNGQCPECNFAFKVDTFYPNNRTSDEVNVF